MIEWAIAAGDNHLFGYTLVQLMRLIPADERGEDNRGGLIYVGLRQPPHRRHGNSTIIRVYQAGHGDCKSLVGVGTCE